jgi:hypothetical protein
MKKTLIAKFAKLAFTLGLGSLALTGCKKDHVAEKPHHVQESLAEKAARTQTDNKLLAEALKGGLEFTNGSSEKGVSTEASTNTRVLINGSIIGHGVAGYQQPYISPQGNLMAPVAELLKRFEYTVSFANNVLTAQRNPNNTFGAQTITIAVGATGVNYVNAQGAVVPPISLPQASVINNGTFFAPARAIAILGGAAIADWDADTKSLQTYYYEVLDIGLYFYGIQQNSVKNEPGVKSEVAGCQKYIPGEPNPFFDPSKPTLIYVHGWQQGGINARGRESFLLEQGGAYENVQNYWKLAPAKWNVAIFHWPQLADDDFAAQPIDTEKKIYDAVSSGIGMRWKRSNGSFTHSSQHPSNPVTRIFRQEYQKLVAASPTQEFRIIGNSLGGNLSMSMLREVAINNGKLPTRVTLSDPYWNPTGISSNNIALPRNFLTPIDGVITTKEVGTDAGQRLHAKGVAIEYTRTSTAGIIGYNPKLAAISYYSHFRPDYAGVGEILPAHIAARHTQAFKQYMWAIAFQQPPTVLAFLNHPESRTGPSPNNTFEFVRSMMDTNQFFDMIKGATSETPNPNDDRYLRRQGKPQ